jgi:hypothetical protein
MRNRPAYFKFFNFQITSEKEKSELAKQWMLIDGTKLNSNLPKSSVEEKRPKQKLPLLENSPKKADEKPVDRLKLTRRLTTLDDGDESMCSECRSVCGSNCTCSVISVKQQ